MGTTKETEEIVETLLVRREYLVGAKMPFANGCRIGIWLQVIIEKSSQIVRNPWLMINGVVREVVLHPITRWMTPSQYRRTRRAS